MRLRISRRTAVALGIACALGAGAAIAFGPVVRSRLAAEAQRRHVQLDIGSVRPTWFGVRLLDVRVRPEGVERADVRLDDVEIQLSLSGHPRAVAVTGGVLGLRGSADELREDLRNWRALQGSSGEGHAAATVPIDVRNLNVTWAMPGAVIEAHGAGLRRDSEGARFHAETASVRAGELSVDVGEAAIEVDGQARLMHFRAARSDVWWGAPKTPAPKARDAEPVVVVAPAAPSKKLAPQPAAPWGRIFASPELRGLRGKASTMALAIAEKLPEGADVAIDALSLKVTKDATSVTIGPGDFKVTHRPEVIELRYQSSVAAAGTPLALSAHLPLVPRDVTVMLEGGPVALSILGAKDGAFGLVDVDRASLAGKGRLVLAAEGDTLTFDGDVRLRGLSLKQPKIASDVVRGIDLGVAARGMLDDRGSVRADDVTIDIGALRLMGSGALSQSDDQVVASARFDAPSAGCQALLESAPKGLLPNVQGAKMAGTFGASGRFIFDSRKIDETVIDYDVRDDCRITEAPPHLARERFLKPFQHRIYAPDGTMSEETTGPGTPKWTPYARISPYMTVAVLTTEDGGFYKHHGFSHAAIKASMIANLKARKFVRGASTISMQLAKNLFLTREKSVSRKLEELILTDYLEQVFSKNEMMEMYLNLIEFGPNLYGITAASSSYFGRAPWELNLGESLFLSSVLPAPLKHSQMRGNGQVPEGWAKYIVHLMEIARKVGLVSEEELEDAKAEPIFFRRTGDRLPPRTTVSRVRHETTDDPNADRDAADGPRTN